ncbi:MAG: cytoskeletal protein CcmA (bactofilin family) [Flavobacteriales bacterium]|jgi:cytoskeletal protein CcmA (bactofilin family)|tara:strand:- start:896 stop:1297 length:402 start_codon:yes stop_codon:yes gene_type:complete
MFTDKKNNQNQDLERNIISKNTSISGDIHSEGDFRIDGLVEGTIKTSGRVVIGSEGTVKGTVECSNADIEGDFFGKLIVSELLSLKSTAKINGEVFINKLSVEPNATFNATCSMKSGVKELNTNERKKAGKTA